MRDFWGYFALAFIAFLIWGFYNGYGLRQRVIQEKLYKAMELGEENGRLFLRHECNGVPTFIFDVDSDSLIPELETVGRLASFRLVDAPSERHLEYKDLVTSFLGTSAAAAIFTFKDLPKIFSKSGKGNWLKMVGSFVGAVSGYVAGKWLGARIGIGCNSQLTITALNDRNTWLTTEKDYMTFSLLAMRWRSDPVIVNKQLRNASEMTEEPLFQLDSPLKNDFTFLEKKSQEGVNPNAADFARLLKMKQIYTSITHQADYDSLVHQHMLQSLPQTVSTSGRFTFRQASWDSAAARVKRFVAHQYTMN